MGPLSRDFAFTYDTMGTDGGIGVLPGDVARPEPTQPDLDYAAGGPLNFFSARNIALGHLTDDVQRMLGHDFYELMQLDSEISSSINTLVECVMSDGIVLSPRITAMPETPTDEQPSAADIEEAAKAAEFVQRSFDRVGLAPGGKTFDHLVAMQYKQGLVNGHKLAEPTLELAEDGPDKGSYVLRSYRLIANRTWSFVVDRTMRIVGYLVYVPRESAADGPVRSIVKFLEPGKFVLFSNDPHAGDPRGHSICRPCWPGWTLKVTLMPIWHQYLQLFASAKTIAEMPPHMVSSMYPDPKGGPDLSPQRKLLNTLVDLKSNSAAVVPNGTKITLLEARSDGQPFKLCVQEVDRQNAKAILGSNRATTEAEYGSRADSQTSKDILDIKVKFQKRSAAHIVEQVAHWLLEVNRGREYADKFRPVVSLGDSGQENFPEIVAAYVAAFTAGILTPDQRAAICRRLRLPMPSAESIAQSVEMHKQQQVADATPPGRAGQSDRSGGGGTEPDNQPTKAKPAGAAA